MVVIYLAAKIDLMETRKKKCMRTAKIGPDLRLRVGKHVRHYSVCMRI